MTFKTFITASLFGLVSVNSYSATVDISITNLTQGIYFTPLLISAHGDVHLFELGSTASPELQAMAEGGDISGLASAVSALGGSSVENPAAGLLAPGSTAMTMSFDTGDQKYLSILAMLLPTNDGFVGLDAWSIPEQPGDYTLYLNAYDAGTEVNDEIVNGGGAPGTPGIPANPGANGGMNGTGVTTIENNNSVHIHRGNIGDTDAAGGASDVDARIHRWLNPVAKVIVTVK
ncbi:spondin domain-containing protein [Teredinibacter sp. KSP-S5-2]|uniref:spondin domain-containing protein n=1 Tax=Teredinibacter sp. KSP-S5-2 TaxID=3034506 RepID=UPI0029352356|nr:spondin domain-containing protein [Teredinibacter sp. KSP-S5-2]WNO08942.1 spondin domain-containing protein [Teredinibacter sp. KSP-S5-2]